MHVCMGDMVYYMCVLFKDFGFCFLFLLVTLLVHMRYYIVCTAISFFKLYFLYV